MAHIVLVHWNQAEVEAHARSLRGAGHEVECVSQDGGAWKPERERPPRALVISLDRLPSHGKAVAEWFWEAKWRQSIPIVFVGGDPMKQEALRERFPQAAFVNWPALAHELREPKAARSQAETVVCERIES